MLISLGGWFDFYDIFMVAYLAAALRGSGFLTLQEMSLFVSAGFAACSSERSCSVSAATIWAGAPRSCSCC
jgi:hypothetical protein